MNKLSPIIEITLGVVMILVGIDILNYFGQYQLPIRALGLAGLAMIMWGAFRIFLAIIVYSLYFYARFISRKGDADPEPETKYKFRKKIMYALMIGSIYYFTFEINNLDNTLHGTDLLVKSVWAAIALSIVSLMLIYLLIPKIRRISLGFDLYIAIPFFLVFSFPATASILNRVYYSKTAIERFTLLKKGSSSSRITQYYLFIENSGEKERLVADKKLWDKIDKNQTIQLQLLHGYFGYKYVEKIIPH